MQPRLIWQGIVLQRVAIPYESNVQFRQSPCTASALLKLRAGLRHRWFVTCRIYDLGRRSARRSIVP